MTSIIGSKMSAALKIEPTSLHDLALAALRANPKNWDGAKDAVFRAVRGDASLLWDLFEPYRVLAIQKLLTEVAAELHEATKADGGREICASQNHAAPVQPVLSGLNARSVVARLSLLDTFKVNGKSVGDLTAREANRWASSRERDARFVRMLTENIPPEDTIRKWRSGEEADALYARAKEMGHG